MTKQTRHLIPTAGKDEKGVCSGRLTFNECHILVENIVRIRDRATFLLRLQELSSHTKDPCLSMDLRSLSNKIAGITDDEFQFLRQDAERSCILFPPNYVLPSEK